MSRTPTIEALEAKRTDLLNQVKQIDGAIKAAKERETQKKSKAILDALAARGLLDSDLDTVLAAIAKASPATPTPAAPTPTPTASFAPRPVTTTD